MARNKIPEDLLTEEQKIRRKYNERYRSKDVIVKNKKSIPIKKQILMTGTDGSNFRQSMDQEINFSQTVHDLDSFRESKFSQSNEKISQMVEIPNFELASIINKLNELNEKISQMEQAQISQIPAFERFEKKEENWKDFLKPLILPSYVTKKVQKVFSLSVILAALTGFIWLSVFLSAPFFGPKENGVISVLSIEAVSCLFMFFAARLSHWSKKFVFRSCAFALMGISLLFCFDSIKQENVKSNVSYKELESQIDLSNERISRLSLQVSALPNDWISKRTSLEIEISKERAVREALTRKLKDSSLVQTNTIQNLAPFFVRLALCLGILFLFEALSGVMLGTDRHRLAIN